MKRKRIIILSGNGKPAIIANNIYIKTLGQKFDLLILEEQLTLKRIIKFLYKKLFTKGFLKTIDLVLLRVFKFLFGNEKEVKKNYIPFLITSNINSKEVQDILKNYSYEYVITNACSILNKHTINCSQKKIINLHNGVNPRYRGSGNFWAFYESNYDLIGTTIHYVDTGIDTGKRICIISNESLFYDHFDNIDINSFEIGAKKIAELILSSKINQEHEIEYKYQNLKSKYYSFPGLRDYLKARRNFYKEKKKRINIEVIWKNSFQTKALKKDESDLEKQHWYNEVTVHWHDEMITKMINSLSITPSILDVGCGNARYSNFIQNYNFYIGIDYSINILKNSKFNNAKPENVVLLVSEARKIPIKNKKINLILAIGLFQHLVEIEDVIKEFSRCLVEDGIIIINTLRKFSKFELIFLLTLLGWKKNIRKLIWALLCEDYGEIINDTLLAKRYNIREIKDVLRKVNIKIEKIVWNGIFNTRIGAREIIVKARKNANI